MATDLGGDEGAGAATTNGCGGFGWSSHLPWQAATHMGAVVLGGTFGNTSSVGAATGAGGFG